jgi:Domain of unknown function (DUF4157)
LAATPARAILQRKYACGKHNGGAECEECNKERRSLQRQSKGSSTVDRMPASVHEVLGSPGQPLDAATRAFMEPRFAHDFSQVRVHTDAKAAESARAVNALAFTVGRDVVFASGEYAPARTEGQRLLAHELAHVTQQHRAGTVVPDSVSEAGDVHEVAADEAAARVLGGPVPDTHGASRPPALQRQTPGQGPLSLGLPTPVSQQSQGEIAVESFLNRMWDAQSKQEKPFRITAKVAEGLNYVFPLGAPVGPLTIFPSPADLMKRLRGKIPPTLDPNVMAVLDRIPTQEKPLPRTGGVSGEPAKPQFGPAGAEGGPQKQPEAPKGASDAMEKALEAAFEQFRKTELGKQLEQSVKSYVFSKEGIPLVIIVAAGVLSFVAANDPKLPSTPDIPLGEGIKLKMEISGKASDLPPLLRALVQGGSDRNPPADKSEVKVGVSATFTFEAVGELAKSVGHFFAEAATWIANGVVKAGTVIGKAVSKIKWELLGLAGGAAMGALIGGLAGGGLGAAIGAALGAGVGLGAALIKRLF